MLALIFPALIFPDGAQALPLKLEGHATQGGLMIGRTAPGAAVTLDGTPVRTTPQGAFVIGFGRDHKAEAQLIVEKDGQRQARRIAVAPRRWMIQRIEGLPEAQVSPPPEVLGRIIRENKALIAARSVDSDATDFLKPFVWPADGPVSGVFGSQRILNGTPKQPHAGLDIAAPEGAPVRAADAGRVTLAQPDLYYTGGTILIDHGHGLSTIYVHLSAVLVHAGQDLARGETIGKVGKTGRATGAHLHFGVSWFNVKLDPALLLPPR